MKSQLFKEQVPFDMLVDILNQLAEKKTNYYLFNKDSFKKGMLLQIIPTFIEKCQSYYFLSKQKYIQKFLQHSTYAHFMTIFRQMIKSHEIEYSSDIKYLKSDYQISYKIYIPNNK